MGITVGIVGIAVAAGGTAASMNSAAHAATNAHTQEEQAQATAQSQIDQANDQQTKAQNQSAQATASAQARVRSIANPDGNTIMTTPLGSIGGNAPNPNQTTNLNAPPPSPGSVGSGKTILGS